MVFNFNIMLNKNLYQFQLTKQINSILLCLVFLVPSFAVRADSVSVEGFDARPQERSNWCWAASIQSIFLTKGLQVEQADIVVAAYGLDPYGRPPNNTAPGFGGTLNILNDLKVGADGALWRVKASAGGSFPNANWLHKELSANKPVMIWYRDENSNHSIVVNGGEYFKDAFGNIQWILLTAYDPWHDKNMTINASNIPKYVYGTFRVELAKMNAAIRAPSNPLVEKKDEGDTSDCPKEAPPFGYIRERCKGITKIAR